MIQEYTCPRCHVKSIGEITSEINYEYIDENEKLEEIYKEEYKIYKEKLLEYNKVITEYQNIIKIHNDHIHHHWLDKLFSRKGNIWRLENNYYSSNNIAKIIGTDEYPTLLEPKQPEKAYRYQTKYITCPVCEFDNYLREN